ncbi:hypothetical protein [Pleionea sp. CnH1-48]|uniref:hypothetical protein n=1 Tax=Pleionea sp. CnH1-48 TaxID=2954494 RepID=UPI0020983DE3|nr:hypothetical protein [Pleionea sp. CnH1-48]MCO7226399.1 hypothetical protein [Pleionea sp. CnH1-48]
MKTFKVVCAGVLLMAGGLVWSHQADATTNAQAASSKKSSFAPDYLKDARKLFYKEQVDKEWRLAQTKKYSSLFDKPWPQKTGALLKNIDCRTSICRLELTNYHQEQPRLELTKLINAIYTLELPEQFFTQSEAYGENPNVRILYLVDASRIK